MPFRGCETFLVLPRLARGANKVVKCDFSLTELDGPKLSSLPPLGDRGRQLVRPEGVKARFVWVKRSLCFLRGCLWWWDPMEKVNLISACNKTSQSSYGFDVVWEFILVMCVSGPRSTPCKPLSVRCFIFIQMIKNIYLNK